MPTSEQITRQQAQDAARARAAAANRDTRPKVQLPLDGKPNVPAPRPTTNVPAAPDTRSSIERYVDEVAPPGIAGHLTKFTKEGEFRTKDTDETIGENEDFICLADQTLIGWQRFNGPGEMPTRDMGLLYENFVLRDKDTLPDRDSSKWELGLDGTPQDPWKSTQYLVLQKVSTGEIYTFSTDSQTGRNAVGQLLRHFNRMEKRRANEYPVVRLKKAGFEHRDPRVGWVNKPAFVVVGKTPKDSAEKPDTSLAKDMNDEIPF